MKLCNVKKNWNLQNEVRQHNERIKLLNQRVIDVDNRVSTSTFEIPPTQAKDIKSNLENDLTFEASGMLMFYFFIFLFYFNRLK